MKSGLLSTQKAMASGIALALGCAFVTATQAAVIIPEKSGFSGYVNLGVGGISVKSNMMASIINGKVDLGDKQIDNLADSPNSSEGGAIPAVNFELSYTFASTRTQVHFGNLLENYLSMEMNTLAGIRQDIGNAGNIGASVQTTVIDTQVWSDPYLTDARRKDTDRTAQGFNVYWQQIMRSGLELKYSTTEIDIDKERSGDSLALSTAQRKLLDRNGDVNRYTMSYEFASDDKHHIVTPSLAYVDRDLDGQAMANDGGVASLNYIYQHNNHWRYVLNATYGDYDYKETNPIYAKQDSANSYGISGTVFYTEPFGWKDWSFNATAGYYEEDNDIDFYDTEVGVVVFAMFRKF
ncbi:MAG: DUF2860 family protein [Halieaceae bacterium]|jgi:hypothetical protein|nr:DUF2860 family protein [Halieaceae bacterium]